MLLYITYSILSLTSIKIFLVIDFLWFEYYKPKYRYLGVFILLDVYWASQIFSLVPVNFRKCSIIITSNIYLFLSLFLLLLVFLLIYFVHFVVILWILDISFNFFRSFFLHFSYRCFYWYFFKLIDSFLNHTKSVDELIKFLLYCFYFYHFFWSS